jgi:hypothetical protein
VRKLRRSVLVLTIALIAIISVPLFVTFEWLSDYRRSTPEFFVGVEFAYDNASDLKEVVDKVKDYTNLFVVGALEISLNQTMLNETCDYVYDAGLSFIVFFIGPTNYDYDPYVWIIEARQKYGDRFLGVYRNDEPGGNQLDNGRSKFVFEAKNYTDAAETHVKYLHEHLVQEDWLYSGARVFTADYGLYWFDYKAGYDTVLAEFGWNFSRQLHVALCRGAARVQNKDWGAIVTWTYNGTPYIESADELYNDLTLAYHAGAKYAVVFNYPKIGRYGILTEEHFDALKKFWNFIHSSPHEYGVDQGEVAYVLPNDYGFGFRSAGDTIWGLWNADELSKKIWNDVNTLVDRYGSRLDIVYNDLGISNVLRRHYSKLIFWNETIS